MKKLLLLLFVPVLLSACTGRKDDPVPETKPDTPVTPSGGEEEGKVFFRRALAMDFTADWCQYCPQMAKALKEAQQLRPGRIVDMSVHVNDNLALEQANDLVSMFGIDGLPSLVFDMDKATLFNVQKSSRFTSYVDKMSSQEACGIAISWKNGKVDVKVKTAVAGTYKLAVAVVEDKIITNQTGYGSNYENDSVVRSFLSSKVDGDSLGSLKAGEEVNKTFSQAAADNQRIVAYVLKGGKCVNAVTCKVNEQIAYTYEEDK